ncbi:MAG: hypothetical protein HY303_02875 [Candidatus Wallbacteria bacterium]|nr:hypothetical protein [Candidatus Wallbacteria bacterium]
MNRVLSGRSRSAITLVETLIGAVLASLVLACLWFVAMSVQGGGQSGAGKARYALDLTELLEVMADDLFNARYVVCEGDESSGTVTLVTYRLDPSGRPARQLVSYSLRASDQTLTRKDPAGPARKVPLSPPDAGGGVPTKLSLDRESSLVKLTVAGRDLRLAVAPQAVAPINATSTDAENFVAPETIATPPEPATSVDARGPAVTPDTAAAATDYAGAADFEPLKPQQGRAVRMKAIQRLAHVPYQFAGGGDERRMERAPRRKDGSVWYTASSNLALTGSRQPLPLLRKGNPLDQDVPQDETSAAPDWYTMMPNPAVEPPSSEGARSAVRGFPRFDAVRSGKRGGGFVGLPLLALKRTPANAAGSGQDPTELVVGRVPEGPPPVRSVLAANAKSALARAGSPVGGAADTAHANSGGPAASSGGSSDGAAGDATAAGTSAAINFPGAQPVSSGALSSPGDGFSSGLAPLFPAGDGFGTADAGSLPAEETAVFAPADGFGSPDTSGDPVVADMVYTPEDGSPSPDAPADVPAGSQPDAAVAGAAGTEDPTYADALETDPPPGPDGGSHSLGGDAAAAAAAGASAAGGTEGAVAGAGADATSAPAEGAGGATGATGATEPVASPVEGAAPEPAPAGEPAPAAEPAPSAPDPPPAPEVPPAESAPVDGSGGT